MTMGDRIKELRKNANMTQEALGAIIGVQKSAIRKYEKGEVKNIKRSSIKKMADVFNVSPAYLMGWEEEPIYDKYDNIEIPIFKTVPLIGEIACGTPILAEENIVDYLRIKNSVNCDYALICKGDSMINARIFDGDVVFIRLQPEVENGEIAAVLIENEATLKRVYMYNSRIELRAENPTFAPINIEGAELENVRIIGKAVAFTSYIK